MSSSTNTGVIPLKNGDGVYLPKNGGIELVKPLMEKNGLLDFYQGKYNIDLYRPLENGSTETTVVSFEASDLQWQAGKEPCEEWEDHGGAKFGSRVIKTCKIGHYSTYCPDHLTKCYENLINPYTNDERSGQFNMLRTYVSALAEGSLLPTARPYSSIAGLFNPDGVLTDGDTSTGNFLVTNKPSNVSDDDWKRFKISAATGCKGWASYVKHNCDGLFDDLKGKLGECKTAEDKAELLNKAFSDLLCCAKKQAALKKALTSRMQYDGRTLKGYIRVSPAIYDIAEEATYFNGAKQENGCTSVCSNFTYRDEAHDGDTERVLFWGKYRIVPDHSLCAWDNYVGGETFAAYFTIDCNIQFTTAFDTLKGIRIPVDYNNFFQVKDYQSPVLRVYPVEKNGGVKWTVQTMMRTGGNLGSENLIVGAICINPTT